MHVLSLKSTSATYELYIVVRGRLQLSERGVHFALCASNKHGLSEDCCSVPSRVSIVSSVYGSGVVCAWTDVFYT